MPADLENDKIAEVEKKLNQVKHRVAQKSPAADAKPLINCMREVRIPAFAKINLRLDVLGKRADGYHELRTIFHTVSLQDELRLRPQRDAGHFDYTSRGTNSFRRKPAEKNLVYRAVDALRRELKIRPGVEI